MTKMQTVPSLVVGLLGVDLGLLPDSHVVTVGLRQEIILDGIDSILGEGFADRALQYWGDCQEFWFRSGAGGIAVERELVHVHQRDDRNGRFDLSLQLAALLRLPRSGEITKGVTASNPDWDQIRRRSGVDQVKISRFSERTVVTFLHTGAHWDDALGGVGFPGEKNRRFTLTVMHAPWRDRRSRRLVTLTVHSRELWPTTTPFIKFQDCTS